MRSDLPHLDSTPTDSSEMLWSLPQPSSDSCLNRAFTYIAQEVAGLLQQSHFFLANCEIDAIETREFDELKKGRR